MIFNQIIHYLCIFLPFFSLYIWSFHRNITHYCAWKFS